MKNKHMLAYSREQGAGSWLKQPGTLAGFLQMPQPSAHPSPRQAAALIPWLWHSSTLGRRLLVPRRVHSLGVVGVGMKPAQTWHGIQLGQGRPLLAFTEATDQEWSGALTGVPGLPQSVPQPMPSTHSSPSCSSTAPSGAKVPLLGAG